MRILLANKFCYPKGGAERSVFETAQLLKDRGHDVVFFSMKHPRNISVAEERYFVSQVDYEQRGLGNIVKASARLLYSVEARRNIGRLIREQRPHVAHLNNIYHQISPSIIHALKSAGVPMVMTLRDYKVVCASYQMVANGGVCEACRRGRYYHCVVKKCVKDSRAKSLLNTVEMYLHHRLLNVYDGVDVFIAPSRFLKEKVEEMGFRKRLVVLPNFVRVAAYEPRFEWEERRIVYFGRLSKEKGLLTLVEAMKELPEIGLTIIGTGPLEAALEQAIASAGMRNVRLIGELPQEALRHEVSRSMFVVLPSEWYENNPRAILEGFALGKPAVATRIGGIPELVREGETGWLCEPNNPEDLRAKIHSLVQHPDEIKRMGRNARRMVEAEFNEDVHYQGLMEVYASAVNHSTAPGALRGTEARSEGGARRRVKIAVVGTRGFPGVQGGVEGHCEQLYPRLVARGCDVVVFTRKPYVQGRDGVYRGVRLIALPCPKHPYLEAFLHSLCGVLYARALSPGALHIHAIGPALFAPLARWLGLRVIVTHHGPDYERQKWGRLAKRVLRLGESLGSRWANQVICISEPIAAQLNGRCRTPPVVIPNGVEIRDAEQSQAALRTFGLEPRKYLLAVGRLVPEKGFHDLIEAFGRLDQGGLGGDRQRWRLVIVGRADHEARYSRQLQGQANRYSNVVFTGFLTGTPLRELYSHAGLFVVPSYYEGAPLVLLEAMSYGLPCVVSDLPSTRGVGLPEECYVRPGDVQALAEKLDKRMRTPLGLEARRTQISQMAKDYSWDTIADRTLAAYRSVLSE